MQKTEIKLIYYLLQNKGNVNKSYRELSTMTGISLGSIQGAMAQLQSSGYIVDTLEGRIMRKRADLIERWCYAYADGFKEKQCLGRFSFLTPSVKQSWASITLPETAFWSGEAAISMETDLIQPERWDIYVKESPNNLIATGRMIPDAKGEIFAYKAFWCDGNISNLLVYADLLATKDDRCKEIAGRIKDSI